MIDADRLRADAGIDEIGARPSPDLTVSKGYAVAVWDRYNGTNRIVQSRTRTPATKGTWRTPVDLSAAGEDARFPAVALNVYGDRSAIWERWDGSTEIIQAAALIPPL